MAPSGFDLISELLASHTQEGKYGGSFENRTRLLLAIDRRDIINDDRGAITTVPRKLGRGSGKTLSRRPHAGRVEIRKLLPRPWGGRYPPPRLARLQVP